MAIINIRHVATYSSVECATSTGSKTITLSISMYIQYPQEVLHGKAGVYMPLTIVFSSPT